MNDPINTAFDDQEEAQIDLTPMLDVVFIMLIFFIVTSTFVKESDKFEDFLSEFMIK